MRNLFLVTLNNGDSCCVILAQMLCERFLSHLTAGQFMAFSSQLRLYKDTTSNSKRYLNFYFLLYFFI